MQKLLKNSRDVRIISTCLLLIGSQFILFGQLATEFPLGIDESYSTQYRNQSGSVGLTYAQSISSGNGAPAQIFESSLSDNDCEMADDFLVPDGGSRPLISFQPDLRCPRCSMSSLGDLIINVYDQANGKPGNLLYTETFNISALSVPLLTFSNSPVLAPGAYWIGLHADLDFNGNNQTFWFTSQDNSAGPGVWHWRNPNLGFGVGCADWEDGANVCQVGGQVGIGALMTINLGEALQTEAIPTLSEWGLLILLLAILSIGLVVLSKYGAANKQL